jgi:hypothetical protein
MASKTPKKRGPKKGAENAGRPTLYKPEYDTIAERMALLGATDVQLSDAFGVSEQTLNAWKLAHPNFLESLKRGKDEADAKVARSLYERALGYSHPSEKVVTVALGANQGSEVVKVPITEHYPPDTTAAIFWLKNRQKAHWRDKHEVEHSGEVSIAENLNAARARALNRDTD